MTSFLSRWSARKSAERQPIGPVDPALTAPEAIAPPHEAEVTQPELSQAELAEKLAALPKLEEIGATTDIRPFLQDFVPAALKKAALRRAWLTDPIISTHLDVGRDYAWEFNSGPLPVGFSEGLGKDAIQRGLDLLYPAEAIPAEPEQLTAEPEEAQAIPPETAAESIANSPVSCPDVMIAQYSPPDIAEPRILQLGKKHGSALPD